MNIHKLLKSQPIILSPMAGVTDFAFRAISAECGASLTVTEMVSAMALSKGSKKTEALLYSLPIESPRSVQLFGSDPSALAAAVRHPALQGFDIIDFNCGCPAPKIVRGGDGCALMADMDKARACIAALVSNTDKPVSVKFRLGINGGHNYLAFGKMCQELGVSFVTLHGRTREQYYAGTVDYDAIKALKSHLSIPVIANGDICDETTYRVSLATGADGVAIGRGAMGRPWIFGLLRGDVTFDRYAIAVKHLELLRGKIKHELSLVNYYKKHLAWYTLGLPGSAELRRQILSASTMCELDTYLAKLKDIPSHR